MMTAEVTRAHAADLEQAVERQIARRTWGRVRRLKVEVEDNGAVVVRGLTSSYYVKQLAIQAVVEVCGGATGSGPVVVDIEVGADQGPCAAG